MSGSGWPRRGTRSPRGLVERRNGFFETSFLPGRVFTSPFDFNIQISQWLAERANVRHLLSGYA